MAEAERWIGQRGYWIDDNEYCEIVREYDGLAGVYEFKSLEIIGSDAIWIGFIEDFFPE